jgi:P27 family predicted phage terminase small subunit
VTNPRAPAELTSEAKSLWRTVVSEYEVTPADLRVLREACLAFDRAEQARKTVDREGLTYMDRFGAPRQHPAAGLELRHREQFAKLMRELQLDGDAAPDPRMPRLAHVRTASNGHLSPLSGANP